jgi:hypothetical protein
MDSLEVEKEFASYHPAGVFAVFYLGTIVLCVVPFLTALIWRRYFKKVAVQPVEKKPFIGVHRPSLEKPSTPEAFPPQLLEVKVEECAADSKVEELPQLSLEALLANCAQASSEEELQIRKLQEMTPDRNETDAWEKGFRSLRMSEVAGRSSGSGADALRTKIVHTRLAFEQADVNHDGAITKEEAVAAGISAKDFGRMDKDDDGEVDRDEFLKAAIKAHRRKSQIANVAAGRDEHYGEEEEDTVLREMNVSISSGSSDIVSDINVFTPRPGTPESEFNAPEEL